MARHCAMLGRAEKQYSFMHFFISECGRRPDRHAFERIQNRGAGGKRHLSFNGLIECGNSLWANPMSEVNHCSRETQTDA